ncbi:MAG TPA: glycosyltransferase family 2 protein [Ktedonobacterales bacterium]
MAIEVSETQAALRDDAFWALTSGGLTALAHANTWAASRRLGELRRLLDGADTEASAASTYGAVARDLASLPGALAATAQAYAELVADYRRARGATSGEPATQEDTCDALLARLSGDAPAPPDALTESAITFTHLTVALPAFNEEAVIAETVASCVETLSGLAPNFEVIVVDDGSRDHTGEIGETLACEDASVRCVHNRPNRGYGGALRAGFDHAEGEWLFFMDSDGQFDIREIARFLRLERERPGIAILGYRAHRSEGFMRRVNAWGWKRAVRALIGLRGVRDVDCAFKLFPTSAIRACALRSTGAAVSAEFLVKFQRMSVPLIEFPVTHLPRTKGSPTGAKPKVILRAFRELAALRSSLRRWRPPEHAQTPL